MWCLLVSVATIEDTLRRLEQRLDEQASEIVALRSKVASLQDDGKAGTDSLFVTPDGRQLSHDSAVAVCCRWTPDSTCGEAVEAGLYETCTGLHEYLEAKTTTYEFADVANAQCLGPTSSNWGWAYNGHHGNVTLKSGATVIAGFRTPLKVMLAQNCANPPSLVVQMDTTMTGGLNVAAALSVSGSLYAGVGQVDVMARMLAFARPLKLSYPTKSGDGNKVGSGSDARNVIVLQSTLGGSRITQAGGEDGIVIEATSASGATAASATEKTWFAVNAYGVIPSDTTGYLKMVEFKVTLSGTDDLYLKPISAKYKEYVGDATETYKFFNASAINEEWGSGTMTAQTLVDSPDDHGYAIASVTFIII